jgi:GNAT superfamily N-acetyltransferase
VAAGDRASAAAALLQVAEDGGRIVGLCGAGPSRDDDGEGVGELYAIYVDPERWGDGTATALEGAAREHLRGQGFSEATLRTVAANARARRFYERCGWHVDGASKSLMGATAVRYRARL